MDTTGAVTAALREADRRARWQFWLFWSGVAIEAALIGAFLWLADWSNRTHLLLFFSTLGVFYAVALGIASVSIRVEDCTRRVLQALSLDLKEAPRPRP
jgi:hypothetical protein